MHAQASRRFPPPLSGRPRLSPHEERQPEDARRRPSRSRTASAAKRSASSMSSALQGPDRRARTSASVVLSATMQPRCNGIRPRDTGYRHLPHSQSYWQNNAPTTTARALRRSRADALEHDLLRLKRIQHFEVVGAFLWCEEGSRVPMRRQVASSVRSAALRKSSLSLAKSCSIGLRSGSMWAGRTVWRRPRGWPGGWPLPCGCRDCP